MQRIVLTLAGLNGLIAVAAGAFGAHGLRARLSSEALAIFETAARYHMYHALALVAVAALPGFTSPRWPTASAWCFQCGIILFCGSLYTMALGNLAWKWLGAITPFGGFLFILGWLSLLLAAWKR